MKKESARSIRLTSEGLTALKTLAAENPGRSQGDLISIALVDKANKTELAPVIRLGVIDPRQLANIQLEAVLAERRLREMAQQILRIRPQNIDQVDKLSAIHKKIDDELENVRKLRFGLSKLARMGSELHPEDVEKIRTLKKWFANWCIDPQNQSRKATFDIGLRIMEAYLLE